MGVEKKVNLGVPTVAVLCKTGCRIEPAACEKR